MTNISKFGQKFTGTSGVLQLMDDLGTALSSEQKMYMLGGGNPSHIPEVLAYFQRRLGDILENEHDFKRMIGNYSSPQGMLDFNDALAELLRNEYGWPITGKNIALTNGSQTAFFFLFNMLAGEFEDGSFKKILLPLAPEYIGYGDLGLTDELFIAGKPEIELLDDQLFKYHVDFEAIAVTDEISAICVSRPTNPTGNVLTDEEIQRLSALAQAHDIPLIIDNAYGTPFPNIIFTEAEPIWNEHVVLCMSLSKLGLPGVRTGIIIANETIISTITGMNAVLSLAPGNIGAMLTLELVKSGKIMSLSKEVIKPYYRRKADLAVTWLREALAGVNFHIHKPEGAIFLWLWFEDLPITCQELYERLKQHGVLVVPGHHFFPGLQEPWQHQHECIRMTYSQEEDMVKEAIEIIGREVKQAYQA